MFSTRMFVNVTSLCPGALSANNSMNLPWTLSCASQRMRYFYHDSALHIITGYSGRHWPLFTTKGPNLPAVIDKVAIYVLTEVRHTGCGRYRQRGRFIQGFYIQWALYSLTWPDFFLHRRQMLLVHGWSYRTAENAVLLLCLNVIFEPVLCLQWGYKSDHVSEWILYFSINFRSLWYARISWGSLSYGMLYSRVPITRRGSIVGNGDIIA